MVTGVKGKFFPKDGVAKLVSHQKMQTRVCHPEKIKKIWEIFKSIGI